jgi:hypothetical protein
MTTEPRNLIQSGIAGGRDWVRENWRNTVIDVNQLPRQLRWLTVFGYGMVLFLLLLFIGLEIIGDSLPHVAFTVDGFNQVEALEEGIVSYGAMFFFALSTILGWGLLMTGASDCRRRIFLPVFFVYFWVLVFTTSDFTATENFQALLQALDVVLIFLVMGFGVVVMITRHLPFWTRYPLVEFAGWSGLTALHLGLAWVGVESPQVMAEGLVLSASVVGFVALPFWFWLGLDAVAAIHEYAYFATHRLQTLLSPHRLRWFVPLFILLEGFIGLALAGNGYQLAIGACLFPPFLILIIAVALLIRRWHLRVAMMVFWGGIAGLLYGVIFGLGLQGSGINEMVLGVTALPPAALFTFLLLYDVMTFGTRAASVEGRIMPRSGRLLMYLGAVILTLGFTIFIFNLKNIETGEPAGGFQGFINGMTFSSIFVIGPFYLLWSLWKSRHDLVLRPQETPVSPE